MAITDIIEETELTAGAPSIKYEGDMNPDQGSGIMQMASMESGQEGTLEEIYFELIADGMDPESASIKAREIYNSMSSQPQDMMQEPRTMAAYGGIMGGDGRRAYVGGSYGGGYGQTGGGLGGYQGRGDTSTGSVAGGQGTGPSNQGGSGGGSEAPTTTQKQKDLFKDLQEQDKKVTKEMFDKGQSNYQEQFNDIVTGSRPMSLSQKNNIKYQNRIYDGRRATIINQLKAAGLLTDEDDEMNVEQLRDKFQNSTDTVGADYGNRTMKSFDEIPTIQDMVDKGFYKKDGVFDKNSPNYDPSRIPTPFNEIDVANVPGGILTKGAASLANLFGKKMAGPLTSEYLGKQFDELEDIGSIPFDYDRDTSVKGLMEEYEPNRYAREYGDNTGGGGDQQTDPCKGPNPPAYCSVGGGDDDEEEEPFQLGLAFRADGGRVGKAYGGSMGDDGRRAYGLGSIFKKIKKVFKSPLGKAALIGLGGYGLSGGLGGSSFMQGLKSQGLKGLLGKAGSYALNNPGTIIPLASAAGALFTEEDEDEDKYVDNTGIDVKKIRENPYDYLPRAMRAEGGPMGGEIMEGESEELLDMNGMEKDYREDGGFVPIGEYEKKDDVPARLSKNEFVFTADAVRGAGEGDVDLGAEKLYTQMKELESVGKRMQGANEMFQTSQRLEEVV